MNPEPAKKVSGGPGRRPYRTASGGQAPDLFTIFLKARLRSDVPETPAFVPPGTRQISGRCSKNPRICSTWNACGREAHSWKLLGQRWTFTMCG